MAETALRTFTFDQVQGLEKRHGLRYELWDGQPVAMTGGTPLHNLIALGLRDLIKPQLARGCDVYVADVGLRLDSDENSNKAYPDVMVLCDPQTGAAFQTEPVLVAEVLSESSAGRDRGEKLRAYTALDSLQAYLILSQTEIAVSLYRRHTGWTGETYRGDDATLELERPRMRLPLRAIYQDVRERLPDTPPHRPE